MNRARRSQRLHTYAIGGRLTSRGGRARIRIQIGAADSAAWPLQCAGSGEPTSPRLAEPVPPLAPMGARAYARLTEPAAINCVGVEQRQLAWLITKRSRVRIPPPLLFPKISIGACAGPLGASGNGEPCASAIDPRGRSRHSRPKAQRASRWSLKQREDAARDVSLRSPLRALLRRFALQRTFGALLRRFDMHRTFGALLRRLAFRRTFGAFPPKTARRFGVGLFWESFSFTTTREACQPRVVDF
jgi:hypothetical protein